MAMANGDDARDYVNRICPISNGLTTVAVERTDYHLRRKDMME